VLTDGEILAVLNAANTGEVAEGQQAKSKATSAAVKDFAQQMVTDHTAALQKDQTTATSIQVTPAPNAASRAITRQGQDVMAALSDLSGQAFDIGYMKSQVAAHRTVLKLIDAAIDQADAADLKTLLTETRATVSMHLEHAKLVLAGLVLQDGGATDGSTDGSSDGG